MPKVYQANVTGLPPDIAFAQDRMAKFVHRNPGLLL